MMPRAPYATPAGIVPDSRIIKGSQYSKFTLSRGPVPLAKSSGTRNSTSMLYNLTTHASAHPTFRVKTIPSSFGESGSNFNKNKGRVTKLTDSYFSPLPLVEGSVPTTPLNVQSAHHGWNPAMRRQQTQPQPKGLLKKNLHQSQRHLAQLSMVFDDN